MRRWVMRAGVLFCLCAAPLAAQTPALGNEFRVNSYTTNNQTFPRIATDATGDFVVVWQSYGQDGSAYGVFGQFFPSFGIQPPEFQANTATTGYQVQPDVAMDGAGNFVVAWSYPYFLGTGIYGQRFDNTGTKTGSEFTVDSVFGYDAGPRVAKAPVTGKFVVVWQSSYMEGSGQGIFARRFDSAGNPLSGRFQVNTYTTGDQTYPAVAATDLTAGFVVVWDSDGQDGSGKGVFGQRYDASGNAVGGEFLVNTYTTASQRRPAVAADFSGNFVVVWESFGQDGSAYGVFGQRFDSSGNRAGGEFRVNTYTTGDQIVPSVAMEPSGQFVVVWASSGEDGDGLATFARRYDASGTPRSAEFQVNAYTTDAQTFPAVIVGAGGNTVVAWQSNAQDGSASGVYARAASFEAPQPMAVDTHQAPGTSSDLNGVLETGETVEVEPAWKNVTTLSFPFSGTASSFGGPPGPTYTLDDASAGYGTIAPGATADCYNGTPTHDCYMVTVTGSRPAAHWDATFLETLVPPLTKTWTLHVGGSFPDVPTSDLFYRYVEDLFHNGVTGGCGGGNYCPGNSVTRAQMAVFLLKSRHGSDFVPPLCTGVFGDVPCPSQFADWIEELAAEGITGGCGGGNYCPDNPVTRAQMAVFLLKAEHGSGYAPPACSGLFGDVPCPSQYANWIEQLAAEAITGGCGGGNYCPGNPNTRGQMAVFLVKTFGLLLYGA